VAVTLEDAVESPGVALIAKERARQVEVEGWSTEHDDQHRAGGLAMAAICYAAPKRVFVKSKGRNGAVSFDDPWPWDDMYDKRMRTATVKASKNFGIPDPKEYTPEERLDMLVKAGALIAAEIDRLLREKK